MGSSGTVTLDGGASNGALTLKGIFDVNDGNTVNLNPGTIINQGTIKIDAVNAGTVLNVNPGGPVTLTGGGTVTLSSTPNGTAQLDGPGGTLINVDNTINGSGLIGSGNNHLVLVNQSQGIIDANVPSGTLTLQTSSDTNTGLLEATGGGILSLQSDINNQNGLIQSSSGSSVLIGNGATIYGGTLKSNSGLLGSSGNMSLDGGTSNGALTIVGTFTVNDGTTATLNPGTIINQGTIKIDAVSQQTVLGISSNASATAPVILTGGGNIVLSSNLSNPSAQALLVGPGSQTVINVDNMIEGDGLIGASNNHLLLINQGTIDANVASGTLILQTASTTNTNLLEASGGGKLSILTTINNQGGTIVSDGTGTITNSDGSKTVVASSVLLNVNNATIQGGTLNTTNGGTMGSAGGVTVTLDGRTHGALTNLGTFTVANSSGVGIIGSIVNPGTIDITAGNSNTSLFVNQTTATLTGGGHVVLSTTGTGTAFFDGFGGTLTNVDNTIEGAGSVGLVTTI